MPDPKDRAPVDPPPVPESPPLSFDGLLLADESAPLPVEEMTPADPVPVVSSAAFGVATVANSSG